MMPSSESLRVAMRMGVPSGESGMESPRVRRMEGSVEARREPILPPPTMVHSPSVVGGLVVPSEEIPRLAAHLSRDEIFLALRDAMPSDVDLWEVMVVVVVVVAVQAVVVERELLSTRSVVSVVNDFILTECNALVLGFTNQRNEAIM